MDLYYGVVEFKGQFAGRVYHFDDKGETEIEMHRGPWLDNKSEAIDDAGDWLDDQEIEASPDGSW